MFPGTEVDSRLLADISPFEDKMMVLKLTEKQIVDAIKNGLELILPQRKIINPESSCFRNEI